MIMVVMTRTLIIPSQNSVSPNLLTWKSCVSRILSIGIHEAQGGIAYVDTDDCAAEYSNPYGDIQVWPPVLYDKAGRSEVRRGGDTILEEVVPSSRESVTGLLVPGHPCVRRSGFNLPKGRINEARGITAETLAHRKKGGHLAEASHDKEDRGADGKVGYQETPGTASG